MVLNQDFRKFVQLLNEHNVRYLVVGGYAVAFYGNPHHTKTIDISSFNEDSAFAAVAYFSSPTL